MIVNTFEKCLEEYKSFDGWDSEYDKERTEALKKFPFSVVVEGVFSEHDQATEWCEREVGIKGHSWVDVWYYKTTYDYGFWEFCFKDQKDAEIFEKAVPKFFWESSKGKVRTNGKDSLISL